jgi:hypothetical protein
VYRRLRLLLGVEPLQPVPVLLGGGRLHPYAAERLLLDGDVPAAGHL